MRVLKEVVPRAIRSSMLCPSVAAHFSKAMCEPGTHRKPVSASSLSSSAIVPCR